MKGREKLRVGVGGKKEKEEGRKEGGREGRQAGNKEGRKEGRKGGREERMKGQEREWGRPGRRNGLCPWLPGPCAKCLWRAGLLQPWG